MELEVISTSKFLNKDFNVYGTIDNPLFKANDIAEIIEHTNVSKMVSNIDVDEVVDGRISTITNGYSAKFLTEDGLYEVLMQSRKPIAKKFKKQIKNILKTIRKTGGYVNNTEHFVESYFGNLDENSKKFLVITLDDKLRVENELRIANNKLEEQKPMVSFAESVAKSSDSIDIGQFAKVIKDEGIKLGRNKMFEYLRGKKYLMNIIKGLILQ